MLRLLMTAAVGLAATSAACAQDEVAFTATDLGGGVYMLQGQGGNIGLSVGDDGVFMIDDQFAPLTPLIEQEIGKLTEGEVRFIVNTHYHGDHTGGNEAWAGKGATLFAHDNVRERLSTAQVSAISGETSDPKAPGYWPTVTFAESLTFHMNGQTVRVTHLPDAHTDGDAVVHFLEADVLHMGDVFFATMFPYVDVNAGGSLDGYVAAIEAALEMAGEDTKIIPGHGPVSSRADMERFLEMLTGVREALRNAALENLSLEDVLAARPLEAFADWNGDFMNEERFIRLNYPVMLAATGGASMIDDGGGENE